jgi:hypothetical protein
MTSGIGGSARDGVGIRNASVFVAAKLQDKPQG